MFRMKSLRIKAFSDLLPRFAQRHQDHQRRTTPGAAAEVQRRDQRKRQGFQTVVAAAPRVAQGRAQRAPHHDRRPRLRRFGHLRRFVNLGPGALSFERREANMAWTCVRNIGSP